MLFKLIQEQKPNYLVVAFDPPVRSFRFAMYEGYKANRQKMPPPIKQLLY
jgi:DNA polymerase-1